MLLLFPRVYFFIFVDLIPKLSLLLVVQAELTEPTMNCRGIIAKAAIGEIVRLIVAHGGKVLGIIWIRTELARTKRFSFTEAATHTP